ncbi:MAG: hypothetical protein ACRESZ_10800 [Methylococcales bacterium]
MTEKNIRNRNEQFAGALLPWQTYRKIEADGPGLFYNLLHFPKSEGPSFKAIDISFKHSIKKSDRLYNDSDFNPQG